MAMRMLIDARHPEETRVAVLKGNRIEEFDFESAEHKQIKGNIYLAKVTRVEPSLQAAFVDFGGNRHGFLAFSEIHPDYYQIPAADRAALLEEEQAAAEEEAALREAEEAEGNASPDGEDEEDENGAGVEEIDTSEKEDVATIEDGHVDNGDEHAETNGADEEDEDADEGDRNGNRRGRGRRQGRGTKKGGGSRAKQIDDLRAKRQALRRRYKIQDVIQRRQVLLVQVVKEERGNKGAALTTYLSLAGRYCVLMPNSSHGGGISRKISSGADRKRLKQVMAELSLPKSMGLIVRTAGLERSKTEIKRDFDYLARLWDEIREKTLASSAPSVIHSDNDLVKRAIRDIYHREIEEVVVEGEQGYKAARQFMKLLMPSHVRRVKAYSDPVPLFQRHGAEDQLSEMYDPVVQLKSGGYLVINPTEALVSIDINSGRSTKEHGIEQTALNTNLEAAREIARQLRLRDMAGLVVIDFIDMESNSSNRKVEKALKDALKNDRARIQVGRISSFGLMEMSRQRLRTGVLEATTRGCPHCDGTGLVRTASSAGLSALRLIEDEAAKGKGSLITLYASSEAAIYLLNAKRADLAEIEARYHVSVEVVPEGEQEGAKMRITSSGPRPAEAPRFEPIAHPDDDEEEEPAQDEAADEEQEEQEEAEDRARSAPRDSEEEGGQKKKRRRRRGGRNRNRNRDTEQEEGEAQSGESSNDNEEREAAGDEQAEDDGQPHGRGRRRRGSRRSGSDEDAGEAQAPSDGNETSARRSEVEEPAPAEAEAEVEVEAQADAKPKAPRRASRRKPAAEPQAEDEAENGAAAPKPRARRRKSDAAAQAPGDKAPPPAASQEEEQPAKPRRRTKAKAAPAEVETSAEEPALAASARGEAADLPADNDIGSQESGPPRRGWWQRTFGA